MAAFIAWIKRQFVNKPASAIRAGAEMGINENPGPVPDGWKVIAEANSLALKGITTTTPG